jgi:hypothetical protein
MQQYVGTKTMLTVGSALLALSVGLAAPALATPRAGQIVEPAAPQTRAKRAAQRKTARETRRLARAGKVDARTGRRIEGSPTVAGGDIIVTGIRQSVQNSIDRKHRARQIVDVVTAEDAGKLPDNNVVEAMARVTGVTVTRSQGRANGYNIRGLDGVQTTVNGVESSTAPLPRHARPIRSKAGLAGRLTSNYAALSTSAKAGLSLAGSKTNMAKLASCGVRREACSLPSGSTPGLARWGS